MNQQLPFFNWSLSKARATAPDSFGRARIGIIFTVLLFSLSKALLVLVVGTLHHQWLQVTRGIVVSVIYFSLIKALLYRPQYISVLAHILLVVGLLVVWGNIFFYAQRINIVTIQFVCMIMLASFYTLGSRWGIAYAIAAIVPVMIFVLFKERSIYVAHAPQELASPGFEIIVAFNFLSIIVIHHLFFQAFHTNVGEKEALNKQLQQSITEAREHAASKSRFLSTMSHELRTPLNSVVGITELMMADRTDVRHRENLEILQHSASDLLSLINNVLDVNKLEAQKLEVEQVSFDLAAFMRKICAGLKVRAEYKQLNFKLETDEQLTGRKVLGDPTRLSQIMYNLVGNAIKFTDTGGITLSLRCKAQTQEQLTVQFEVRDTGSGIPAERQAGIFEPFVQGGADITRRYGGTGLGLSIVKQVLELMGSTINLESTPGEGSRFYFSLVFPVAEADVPQARETDEAVADLSGLKLLIAEDTATNRLIISRQLEWLGLQATIVENGRQAFEAYFAGDFDAVLVDLHMPVMDGYATLGQIRALEQRNKAMVYMIAFTASITEQERIMGSGFNDVIYKPVNMTELRKKLERIVEMKSKVQV